MAPDLKSHAADNFDLSPSFSPNSLQTFRYPTSDTVRDAWMKGTKGSGNLEFTNSCDPDGWEYSGDYQGQYFDRDRHEQLWREEGRYDDAFVEQCQANDCFFGCGGHHTSAPDLFEFFDSSTVDWGYRPLYTRKTLSAGQNRIGRPAVAESPQSPRSMSPESYFDPAISYEQRYSASVPSTPTQPLVPRHRRLSVPLHAPTSRGTSTSTDIYSTKDFGERALSRHDSQDRSPSRSKENPKPTLFKTELCRSWEEKGSCRYGTKCQFAHSLNELRPVPRHPKYKTQLCKTFLEVLSFAN